MKYDVFISYSSQDQKIVEGICGYLEARGIRCFVAYRDIPRGVVWASAIVDALDESSMMVVAFSDSFNQSKQVDREIELASEDDKPILTFRLSESKFSGAKRYYLKNLNWIDAFPKPDNAFGELYKNICKLLGKEEATGESSTNSSSTSQSDSRPSEMNPTQERTQEAKSQEQNQTNSLESQLAFDPVKGEFKLKTEDKPGSGFINGHEWVDLGLPSGLKWATCNVGASRPEEYGDYFAFGQIQTQSSYYCKDCQTYRKSNKWLHTKGYIDDKGNLTLSHDAARQNWGSSWRLPTLNEIKELVDNTTTDWTTLNGVIGRLVKSKRNGNSIFIPAAGQRYHSEHLLSGEVGAYWGSTPDESVSDYACCLDFDSEGIGSDWYHRDLGRTVRAVSE